MAATGFAADGDRRRLTRDVLQLGVARVTGLKDTADNLGANEIVATCQRIDETARSHEFAELGPLVEELERQLELVDAAVAMEIGDC